MALTASATLVTTTRVVLCLLLASHLLAHNQCSGQHILITIPSSQLTQGATLHSFGTPNHQLLHHEQDCPEDIFAVGGTDLILTSNITLEEESEDTFCFQDAESSVSYTAIRIYRCYAVDTGTTGAPLSILVQPEFLTTRLEFHRTFYSGSVVEGVANTSVTITTPQLGPTTLPRENLLLASYRVTGEFSHMFGVHGEQTACRTHPVLVAIQPLDRETQGYYEVTLEAYALYAPTIIVASTTVGITVLDVNDNPPSFSPTPPQQRSELELRGAGINPGTEIARYQATDLDSGINRESRFSVADTNTVLTLHPLSGSLYLFQALVPQHPSPEGPLSLRVQDLGDPSLSSTTNLTLFISTINVTLPPDITIHGLGQSAILQQQGELVVRSSELATLGEQVITVEVIAQGGADVVLELLNIGPCECFNLSEPVSTAGVLQYTLIVASPLDFESNPAGTYRLVLTASYVDHTPPLASSLELRVEVTDANEPPLFPSSSYTITVLEGVPVGTNVAQLTASDPDGGANGTLSYSLQAESSIFAVDSSTGLIYTLTEIDFESLNLVELTVVAEDGEGLTAMASLSISIRDRNDNPPSFVASSLEQSVTIPEDHDVNRYVFQFVALDKDTGCNGVVEYYIIHADPDVFSLQPSSGLLYPARQSLLDYESFQTALVVVGVADLGEEFVFSAETTLRVTLTDVNDEVPEIDTIDCPCFITEHIFPSSCQPLSAYDRDIDRAGLTYQISSGDAAQFEINSNTGVVSIRQPLDRESADTYQLEITVSDGVHTSSPQILNVIVVDTNDHPPFYGEANIMLTIPVDLSPGDVVGNLAATDPDVGYNALTTYQIVGGGDTVVTNTFRLDPLSGVLYVTQAPALSSYVFTVSARDLLNPLSVASLSVDIQASGMKNNPPSFTLATDSRTIPEDLPPGSSVAEIMAEDGDTGLNGELMYRIVEGADLFQLQSDGLLMLSQSVSGRAGSVFTLNISACDQGTVPLKAYQLLVVTVYARTLDMSSLVYNPNIPVCHYTGSVIEGLVSGAVITPLEAMQDSLNIQYRILEGDTSSAFQLSQDGLTLEAMGGFADVFNQTVFVTLLAEYGPNFHKCSVTVSVQDVNNHPPVFSTNRQYSFEVYRGTPVMAAVYQVTATDADVGVNARTTYSITSPTPVPFDIDDNTGAIRVSGSLDQSTYSFSAVATDNDLVPAGSDMVTVTAIVVATSNAIPIFQSPSSPLTVPESTRGLVAAAQISDSDGDINSQARNSFCIAAGNLRGAFEIAMEGGELIATERLDYESLPSQLNITLLSYDSSSNPVIGTSVISIILEDVNEAAVFSVPVYRATVREGEETGLVVVNVTATDTDAGDNGILTYAIPGNNPFFAVDAQTGAISTTGTLNRENMPVITFNVMATDGGSPGLSSQAEVQITLQDINTFSPAFDSGGAVAISEDLEVGGEVVLLSATDRDSGVNAQLQFTITAGNSDRRFSLDPWTGSLTLAQRIDFEADPTTYILTLQVRDLGTPSLASPPFVLTISVTDANEHGPTFSSPEYQCNISENTATFQETCQVSATDADRSGNDVSFSLADSSLFTVDPSTGVIVPTGAIPSQDRMSSPKFVLPVQATDSYPNGAKTSTTLVIVNVIDTNDAPVSELQLAFSFYEGVPVNTLLFYVHAHDRDVGDDFSTVTYGKFGAEGSFRLDRETGAVFLVEELDYEAFSSPQMFQVIASNSEVDPATSTFASYEVSVLDVSENTLPPVFPPDSNPSLVWLSRASPVGTHVLLLDASDPEGQVLRYDITGGSGVGYFQIDPNIGNVITTFPPASIQDSSVTLEIRVLDSSTHPLPSWHEVTIVLSQATSSKPFFIRPVFRAAPSEGAGDILAAVRAEVEGQLGTTSISYSIREGNDADTFTISDQTGAISLASNANLDRELQSLYNIVVQADSSASPGESSVALLVVEVEDTNDFRTTLESNRFNFTVFESFPVGSSVPVARIFALDNDIGENGRISYSLTSGESDPTFAISSDTGYLYLTRSLDRTQLTSHSLTVTAMDNGTERFMDSVAVAVTVEPTALVSVRPILQPIPSLSLSEDTPPGTLITTAALTNAGDITYTPVYRLLEQSTVISILPNSGEVYLTTYLDYETDTTLSYTVQVLDGRDGVGIPSTPLLINIMDVNDNRPVFNQRVYSFELSEGLASAETQIGRVVAVDSDASSEPLLRYSLIDSLHPTSADLFIVNSTDGLITVSGVGGIDREEVPVHTLIVAVTDGGSPALMDFATVNIRILDVDDHAPQFLPANVEVYVTESTLAGEGIYTATAFDPDQGTNADIAYELVTASVPFGVNSTTGKVTLATPLDAEIQLVFSIVITAFNPNDPSFVSAPPLNLTVHVLDVLDSAPELMTLPAATIRENYPAYSRVIQILSPTSTRQVYYSIISGDSLGHFLIEPLTGVLRTATPLDREEVDSYELVIQGAYGVRFRSNLTLTVLVTDANDESPRFRVPYYIFGIPENSQTGVPLANLDVDDPDDGPISTFVIPDAIAATVFSIDSSGNIILNNDQELDREGGFSSLRFLVHAIDSGNPMQYSTAEIQIDITDQNDPPHFEEMVYAFILSAPVIIDVPQFEVRALDMDIGTNGELSYSLQGGGAGGTFSIDSTTGDVSVSNNFMLRDSYTLRVTATDGGGMEASADVNIIVRSCNFMNLTFSPSSTVISVSVPEDTSASSVIVAGSDLQVIDLDIEGMSADVRFTLPLADPSFEIEELSGDILVLGLDRETTPVHRLVVQATDVSDSSRVAQAQVVVTVLDVNDNPPVFAPPTYSHSISTQEPAGPLLRVMATDPDEDLNSDLTYSITTNPLNSFSIDPTLGVIFLTANITQLGDTITLVVTATDRGSPPRSSNARVFISIIDPRAPTFSPSIYTVTIPEDTPTNTGIVNLTLADSAQSGEVSFRFVSTDTPIPFSVSANGVVSLVDPGVDYEVTAQRNYTLMVRARDSETGLAGFAIITVDVTDSNDNAPVFGSNSVYTQTVSEDATGGTLLLPVSAQDQDSTPNALISYRLASGGSGLFSIQPNGNIYLSGDLDYETTISYELEVLAEDSGSPSMTGSATVFITLLNINDNPPEFRQAVYETFVRDNDQPGATNLFVSAEDPDNLEELVYMIVPGPAAEAFSVSENGRINLVVANPMEISYTLNVSAFDGVFYGYTTVVISVEGVNANLPVFNQTSYAATVPESAEPGLFVARVFATDEDRGTNGQVSYLLQTSESRFTINTTTGVITTSVGAVLIDRETTPSFTILVTARDGGSFSTITELVVTVIDINDNAPTFSILQYFGTIISRSMLPLELTVTAFDPDIGSNGMLNYTIINPLPDQQFIFSIGTQTGIITNFANADHEIRDRYQFTVRATDNGNPPHLAPVDTMVTIDVIVDGTPMPSFEQNPYSVAILENATLGTSVLELALDENSTRECIQVTDSFVLTGGGLLFGLRGNTIIILSEDFDVRTRQVNVETSCLTVSGVIRITTSVFITVLEVNDPPQFQPALYMGTVMENAINTAVQINPLLTVVDPDPENTNNGTVSLRIVSNADKFDITTGGIIVTRARLDFEVESERFIVVEIEAMDMGSPPQTATAFIAVTVIDVNDNPPVFNQTLYSVSVLENASLGALVHTAEVTDLDADSTHMFSISGIFFCIGETSGEVRLASLLDRETQVNHTAEIVASDGVNTTSAFLSVLVLDANDNPPVFNPSVYEVELPENYPTGVTFTQVFATDDDEGDSAIITYGTISTDNTVAVDSSTGHVSFLLSPDHEAAAQLSLSIQATDIFNELRDIATVIVRLTDENDNAPEFRRGSYTASISENLPVGSTVEIDLEDRVEAIDRDSGENGTVAYHIEGQGASYFSISNGDIVSLVMFDREVNDSVEIVVVATDMGSPAMSSNTTVLVRIADQNDNYPIFPQSIYRIEINESEMINSSVFTTRATDLDAGVNGEIIRYSRSGENADDFRVETDNGSLVLYISNGLDHENQLRRVYTLTLIALDGALKQGNATLIVNIVDVNDNPPEIPESVYSLSMLENVTTNTVLIRVNATDRDASNQILYSIRNIGNHPELSINTMTGEISVATTLDFETVPKYDLTVVASDSINEDTALIIITVIDINDNPPVFLPHDQVVEIQENGIPGILLSLPVTDVDSDLARITYSITSGNVEDTFRINFMGDLEVMRMLDREAVSAYTLTITVQDNGSPSLSNTTTILVQVTDVNDNSPTGGHQDIYLFLYKGLAPLISLGEVFVNDSDIVNDHRYTLLPSSGADNILIQNDGFIRVSSRSPEVGTYSFIVTISDFSNTPVNTTISVLIRDVSDETLSNSFRMQFSSITPQRFVDDRLGSFLGVATRLLDRELSGMVDIQAISIQPSVFPSSDSTDMTIAVWNITDGSYFPPLLIQHIFHVRRAELETPLSLRISTVFVDMCSDERCSVGTTCGNRYEESLSETALGSRAITYLGVASSHTFTCEPVISSPCDGVSCPEPAYCLAVEDRAGSILAECVQDCSSAPCRNGGVCVDQTSGYYCSCPAGREGRNCELTIASFSRDSYVVLSAVDTRTYGTLSLEFNTRVSENSLLLFTGRFDQVASDFMFVEFLDRVPCLTFSLGGGRSTSSCLETWPYMGDGLWHTLVINYSPTELSFSVITYNPYSPDRTETTLQNFHSFDLGAPLILGRLPAEFDYSDAVPSRLPSPSLLPGFSGCVRSVMLNGEVMDLSSPLMASGVTEGCGCEADLCKNEGTCFGTGQCDCTPEFTGQVCTEESSTVAFLGEEFIKYQISGSRVRPLRRRRQVSSVYTTAQNIISLSFTTEESSGTLLQLGDPRGSADYALLKIANGYIQLHFDLGSGGRVLLVSSRRVNDAESHSLVVTRTEDTVELLLDDMYINRTSAAGSGDNVTLQISSDQIYLGAQVDVLTGELTEGFRGCLTGIRLDRKDLPFTAAGNEDFSIIQFSSGDVIPGCPLSMLKEGTQPSEYIYGGIGGILGGLLVISFVFVLVCVVGGYCWRARRGEHLVRSRGGSPSHGGFSWQPAYNSRKSPPVQRDMVTLSSMKLEDGRFSPTNETDDGLAESTFTATQEQNRHRSQSPQFHSRQPSGRRQQVAAPAEGFTAVSQANPGFLQESPLVSDHEETRPPNRFITHMRSLSGQQSIRSTGSGKSDVTYIPREVLGMDDAEVAKYIHKKVEAADAETENYDVDALEHFSEEGPFEPLGSIGSLYDFVRNPDSETQQTPLTSKEVTTSQSGRPSPVPDPPPLELTAAIAPSGNQPNSHISPPSPPKPSSSPIKPSSRPSAAPKAPIPTKPPVSPTKPPVSPTKPASPDRLGRRPMPLMVRTNTSPLEAPPPSLQALTRTNTSPIKSPTSSAPPGYETKPAEPVLLSPPPSQTLSQQAPSDTNGLWLPISKHSASQPEQTTNHSKEGRELKSDPSKIRRSGRRTRVAHQKNNPVGNILDKFHQVTANGGHTVRGEANAL